ASSRYAPHWPGGYCSTAARKSDLTRSASLLIARPPWESRHLPMRDFHGRRPRNREKKSVARGFGVPSQAGAQPGAGIGPLPVSAGAWQAECLAGVLDGQAGKEPELDQFRGSRVLLRQLQEG